MYTIDLKELTGAGRKETLGNWMTPPPVEDSRPNGFTCPASDLRSGWNLTGRRSPDCPHIFCLGSSQRMELHRGRHGNPRPLCSLVVETRGGGVPSIEHLRATVSLPTCLAFVGTRIGNKAINAGNSNVGRASPLPSSSWMALKISKDKTKTGRILRMEFARGNGGRRGGGWQMHHTWTLQ